MESDKIIAALKDRGEANPYRGSEIPNCNYIPTGIFTLDLALLGGFPDGRATMVYGVEGSGKSSVGMMGLIGAQKKYPDKNVVLLDLEQMYEDKWFEALGGDSSRIIVLESDFGEAGLDSLIELMDAEDVAAVMLDSVAAIGSKNMDERSVEDYGVGERARLASLFCSKCLHSWSRERKRGHSCSVILINQYRDAVGKMIGDPRKLPGGWQINYFAKTRFQMKGKKQMGEDSRGMKIADHNLHTFTLTKDKGASIQTGEFKMNLNRDNPYGIPIGQPDQVAKVCMYAKRLKLIYGGGQAWKLDGVEENGEPKKFKKLIGIEEYLVDNPDEFFRIQQQILVDVRVQAGMDPLPPDGYLLGPCDIEG